MNLLYRPIWGLRLLLVVSIASACSGLALDRHRSIAQYVHNSWTFQSGLPANAVNAILQTRDGYLWLGTSAGLLRFDGASFSEVSTNPKNNKAEETITALCETRDGSLWIGTAYGGLRVFKDGRMLHYDSDDGFLNVGVRELFETRAGHLLVGTIAGIFSYREGKFDRINLDQHYITGIAEDSQNRIWVGTIDGVRIFNDDGSTNPTVTGLREGLPYPSILSVFGDREGNMWVGTYGGLARFKDGKATSYTSGNGLINDRILTIFEDRDGQIWVGTEKGIDRFSNGVWNDFTNSDGLTSNEVLSFAEDRESSLWVGTANGLNQFEDPNITTYTTKDGLADNHASTMVQTRDSSIYILSDQSAIMTRLKNGKFNKYNNLNIPGGPAFAARDGSVWIAQTGGTLSNFKNGKVKQYGASSGVPQKWISAITEDDKSLIFYSDGMGIFRLVRGHAAPYLIDGRKPFPSIGFVVCFLRQRDGTLWIGTLDSLVKVQHGVLSGFTKRDGLAGNWTSSLYDDQQGGLWIGSKQGGLTLFKNGKFTSYDTRIGLLSDEIDCVLGDDQSGIWMSSGNGIGCAKRQELEDYAAGKIRKIHSISYGSTDGIKSDAWLSDWQPSGLKAYDGHIWFATKGGAAMIDPGGFAKNKLAPTMLIENVIADQLPVSPDSFAIFPSGTDKLEFHYDALSFKVPQKVLFKYKLEGYDRNWVDAGTRRVAYYTNLPPGNYEFLVIACNNDGIWNNTGANFRFELKPHFYETYWFLTLLIVVSGGVIFGVYRLRVWQLLRREKQLNARIQQALAHIKTLGGLIPICSNCKKIRDDEGYWEILEKYVQTHSDAQFSHGICPDCAAKLYPDFPIGRGEKNEKGGQRISDS